MMDLNSPDWVWKAVKIFPVELGFVFYTQYPRFNETEDENGNAGLPATFFLKSGKSFYPGRTHARRLRAKISLLNGAGSLLIQFGMRREGAEEGDGDVSLSDWKSDWKSEV